MAWAPVYHQGRLYLASDTEVMMCLDATSRAVIWQERLKGRFSMSPILAGDKVILIPLGINIIKSMRPDGPIKCQQVAH
ncbi:MAG: outer membrane protein assembly factor BamB family protein [Planctomycetota bacterium]